MTSEPFQPNIDRLTSAERRLLRWGKREERRFGSLGMLLEGAKLVEEGLKEHLGLNCGWFTGEFAEDNRELLNRLRSVGCRIRPVSSRVMRQISDMETPPGIAVVSEQVDVRLRNPFDPFKLIVALIAAQDPGNLGGVIRTADYFGVDEVWLSVGSADPFGPKALRGAMGATFRVPVARFDDLRSQILRFKKYGAVIWAAVAHGKVETNIIHSERMILLFGNESRGLSPDELKLADKRAKIAGAGRGESLNLGVAVGIMVHQALVLCQ
ncbi:MAG: RNA methyltransferase [Calditrichaeota bacterium]|nr:RNA methyltransferase [Calditrichota bacterium]